MNQNQVIDKIRKLREDKSLSQQNVADELDMKDSSTYSKIETGKSVPNLTRLFKLAEIFDVNISEFFTDTVAPSLKEPKDSYGNMSKEDIEKLNLAIQGLQSEIISLLKELAQQKKK